MIRAGSASMIVPNCGRPKTVALSPGGKKFVWFQTLNSSARNSSRRASLREGELVLVVDRDAVRDVQGRERLVQAAQVVVRVPWILLSEETGDRREVVEQLRPGVGREHLQAASVALPELRLKPVVARV